MMELLWAPLLACLVLTAIHVYLGLHVLARGVIFVDLAFAQIAAREHVEAEVRVDAGEHEAGQQRQREDLDREAHGARAAASRLTLLSKSVR